jgi:regulator of sigma E protease
MNYIAVLFIIGTLILVHELGHFLAARAVGIRIELFSIGFGPALWKKRSGDTEYRISLVPLGGYVMPAVSDEH